MDGARFMSGEADRAEYAALLAASAELGRDPLLVQGAGGNTSLKSGDVLWVKASGTWLADAEAKPIMVKLHLGALRAALAGAAAERAEAFVIADPAASGLRPSIESTLHAALDHRVVIHVHCVNTIAWATRGDARTALAPLLDGLDWAFIPYVRPGAPLTRAILAAVPPRTPVLVLGHHGLVVGGPSVAAARALVAEVGRRLSRTPRLAPAPDLARLAALAAGAGYVLPADAASHGTATDPASLAVARRGSLYPDHVIFLGAGVTMLGADETPALHTAPLLLVPGAGVLLRADASAGAAALARCLADVTARLDPAEDIAVLDAADEAELAGWDAEKYRRTLDRAR